MLCHHRLRIKSAASARLGKRRLPIVGTKRVNFYQVTRYIKQQYFLTRFKYRKNNAYSKLLRVPYSKASSSYPSYP